MDPEIGGSNGHEELSGIATTRARFRGVRTRERERRARDDRMLPAEKESLVPGPIARQHVATSRQAARPSFAHHTCATLPTPSETIDFNERRNNRFSIRVYSRIFSAVFERLFVFVFSWRAVYEMILLLHDWHFGGKFVFNDLEEYIIKLHVFIPSIIYTTCVFQWRDMVKLSDDYITRRNNDLKTFWLIFEYIYIYVYKIN